MHRSTLPRAATLVATTLLLFTACTEPNGPASATASLATRRELPPARWAKIGTLANAGALAVTANGTILAASDLDGLFASRDDGRTWQPVGGIGAGVTSLAVAPNGEIYAATAAGVLRSLDNGAHWVTMGLEDRYVAVVGLDGRGSVFAGSPGFTGGLYRWSGEGTQWSRIYVPLSPRDFTISYLSFRKSDILLGTHTEADHLLRSGEGEWTTLWSLFQTEEYLPPTRAMIETPSGTLLAAFFAGVLRSSDAGSDDDSRSWRTTFTGAGVQLLSEDRNGAILASTDDGSVYRSADDGVSWTRVAAALPGGALPEALVMTPGGAMITATFEGVFRSVGPQN
jgi:hypothetical protein